MYAGHSVHTCTPVHSASYQGVQYIILTLPILVDCRRRSNPIKSSTSLSLLRVCFAPFYLSSLFPFAYPTDFLFMRSDVCLGKGPPSLHGSQHKARDAIAPPLDPCCEISNTKRDSYLRARTKRLKDGAANVEEDIIDSSIDNERAQSV